MIVSMFLRLKAMELIGRNELGLGEVPAVNPSAVANIMPGELPTVDPPAIATMRTGELSAVNPPAVATMGTGELPAVNPPAVATMEMGELPAVNPPAVEIMGQTIVAEDDNPQSQSEDVQLLGSDRLLFYAEDVLDRSLRTGGGDRVGYSMVRRGR
ncbi:hypothetical protein R1sor_027331 [Riccia sorocarpa]|uniref:Uncharacterized protein n=1 Tax=Riccia sorocarpa TaxID=122646 RepID=A0ABD3GDW6_9MARC